MTRELVRMTGLMILDNKVSTFKRKICNWFRRAEIERRSSKGS